MALHDILQKHRVAVSVVSVAVIALVVARPFMGGGGHTMEIKPRPTQQYFYDLNTTKLFPGPIGEIPPIAAPSGASAGEPAGALAYVYSCGQCDTDANWQIGYIEMYTPAAKTAKNSGEAATAAMAPGAAREAAKAWESGHMIARPQEKPDWVVIDSEEGQSLLEEVRTKCGAAPQILCGP